MASWFGQIGLVVLALLAAEGCTPLQPLGKSPLAPAQMSSDSVVLDIFFVRFPFGKDDANGPLWQEIDEQPLPAEVRRRLTQNGFRAGMVGGHPPLALSQLLELKDKPVPTERPAETRLAEMDTEPRVVRRHLQLRAGQPSKVVASEIYEQLPVLTCESGDVCGRTYPKAQGMLTVKAHPQSDGRVRLEVVPEVEYGEVQQRFAGHYGALRLETGRPHRSFDNLAISATLVPGSMLVLSSLPNRTGSLGHHFFTHQASGKLEQKLMVIRLGQTQHDDLFDPQEPQPLDLKTDTPETTAARPSKDKAAKAKK